MENEFKYNDLVYVERYYWRNCPASVYRFRNGSVPGISKPWKKSNWRWKGTSKMNDRRNVYLFDEDDDLTPNQIRSIQITFNSRYTKKGLAALDPWNDTQKGDWRDRSWKRHRKTRWK